MSLLPEIPKGIAKSEIKLNETEKQEFIGSLKSALLSAVESIEQTIKKDRFTFGELIGGAIKAAKKNIDNALPENSDSQKNKLEK